MRYDDILADGERLAILIAVTSGRKGGPVRRRFAVDVLATTRSNYYVSYGAVEEPTLPQGLFLLDPWWNPAVEAQAIDRVHRIGQSRPVTAYRLVAEDTVEERVIELQGKKRDLAEAILSEDNAMLRDLSRADLERLLS